jgi:hypothetical protein
MAEPAMAEPIRCGKKKWGVLSAILTAKCGHDVVI